MIRASKRTRQRRAIVAHLDAEAREAVFERDGKRCIGPPRLGAEPCGKSFGIQWAHVVSRRYKKLRHLPENGMTLCAGCHLAWHHNPLESGVWFKETYPDRYRLLMEIKHI